jgi:hypothetical protein
MSNKAHREVLDADMVHLRRPDGRGWDGFLHVNPQGREKALAFLYNPLPEEIEREVRLPLYYAGLTDKAQMSIGDGTLQTITLDRDYTVTVRLKIPAQGRQWILFVDGESRSAGRQPSAEVVCGRQDLTGVHRGLLHE